jgi:hypothetical protein
MPLIKSRKTTWEGLNGTHHLLVYVDDVNLLGDNIGTIKKNTDVLIVASKEVGLEANAEKTNKRNYSRSFEIWHSSNICERQ